MVCNTLWKHRYETSLVIKDKYVEVVYLNWKCPSPPLPPEAEFWDVIGAKSKSFPPFYSQSPLLTDFTPPSPPPPPPKQKSFKLVCNIGYRNLKPENSQDYVQKPQRNCTFMTSASGQEPVYSYTFLGDLLEIGKSLKIMSLIQRVTFVLFVQNIWWNTVHVLVKLTNFLMVSILNTNFQRVGSKKIRI